VSVTNEGVVLFRNKHYSSEDSAGPYNIASGQRISPKAELQGAKFSQGTMLCDTDHSEHCSRRQQLHCHAVVED